MALPYRFMLTGIVALILGMVIGLYMGPSQDFTLVPVHVHLNLLGWATMMLIGLYYRGDAVSAATRLAHWHFWIAFVGLILFVVGLTALYLGNPSLEIVLIIGSFMALLSILIFGWIVWQASQRQA
jgi:hypothetical protein